MDAELSNLSSIILPILIRLLNEEVIYKKKSISILSELILYDKELQTTISQSNILQKIQNLIHPMMDLETHFIFIKFLAALSSLSEEGRQSIISNASLLGFLISSIMHHSENIREKSSECFKGISRSSLVLRNVLMENRAYIPLLELLRDQKEEILINTVICLGNLLLDFSSFKKEFVESEFFEIIFQCLNSKNYLLKLNTIGAIKNLAFQADSMIKSKILKELKTYDVKSFLIDSDDSIQKNSLNLMRNLIDGDYDDITMFIETFGKDFILFIIENSNTSSLKISYEVLYLINNVSAGLNSHKLLVMNEKVLNFIFKHLQKEDEKTREASMWILLNLTWKSELDVEKRKEILSEMKFDKELELISQQHSFHDIKSKAQQLIEQFKN